jgi:hypothetical protein
MLDCSAFVALSTNFRPGFRLILDRQTFIELTHQADIPRVLFTGHLSHLASVRAHLASPPVEVHVDPLLQVQQIG